MVKTSLLHRGLSVAYFSSKRHSWVGGLECTSDAKSIDLYFRPGGPKW